MLDPPQLDLHSLTRPQLSQLLASWDFAEAHARRLWSYLYSDVAEPLEALTDLPRKLLERLQAQTYRCSLSLDRVATSDDKLTKKFLLGLHDREQIETVEMVYVNGPNVRVTACLSSQVGCTLGCVFCATGQLGFTRDLTAGEIVAQALFIARRGPALHERLGNLVLMGMGEPLLNYDAVLSALEILHDPGALAIGAKQITISTVGVIPGIVRLADEGRKYSLAVSLHAAHQGERLKMIPAARPWPLDELMAACRYYTDKLQQKIFFEWTFIAGNNDSPEQARELAALLQGIPAQVNLIPLNPTNGFAGAPGLPESIERFRTILRDAGIPSSVRQRRGIDIAAGCGQLAAL